MKLSLKSYQENEIFSRKLYQKLRDGTTQEMPENLKRMFTGSG